MGAVRGGNFLGLGETSELHKEGKNIMRVHANALVYVLAPT